MGKHGYTPSAGIPELRAAAATYMGDMRGIEIDADDVVVGAGAKPFRSEEHTSELQSR